MKPKARKFRIRRSAPLTGTVSGPDELPLDNLPRPERFTGEPAQDTAPVPGSVQRLTPRPPAPGAVHETARHRPAQSSAAPSRPASPTRSAQAAPMTPEQEIDAIRREGLTGRQLRMARRVAQKHGIAATSDFDAVRLLRAKGIDPFERSNMLALVQSDDGALLPDEEQPRMQLPQTVSAETHLPSTETMSPADRRTLEVAQIQKDIAKRRRKRLMLLMSRLAAFVLLPTFLVGYYFYALAHPLYSTKTEFLILEADGGGGGIGGLLSGTQFATNQDSIATQSYLQSKDAMIRLDGDVGFKSHFSDESIDPIQRLSPNPSNEEAYDLFEKMVKIGYDPTEGVIRMEVIAADPHVAAEFSSKLISYAEERVDHLSQRKREDQLRDSRAQLDEAKAERRAAQQRLVELQEGTFIDPEGVIGALRSQITTYEIELQEKQLQLRQLLDNRRPSQARVQGVEGDIRRLEGVLAELQRKMNEASVGESSLAQKTAQIQMAQADLATADMFLQTTVQNLKSTEQEANRQVRYLTTSVAPVASEDPSYPRKFENTVLAFLIFSGIYLMVSLTASILREQVSS